MRNDLILPGAFALALLLFTADATAQKQVQEHGKATEVVSFLSDERTFTVPRIGLRVPSHFRPCFGITEARREC